MDPSAGCTVFARRMSQFLRAGLASVLFVALPGIAVEPVPSPDIRFTETGRLTAAIALSDGGYVVGGAFELVNGIPIKRLARFHADGSMDLSWNPNLPFGDTINALAVDDEGNLYAASVSGDVGGLTRYGLIKLSPSGELDSQWAPMVSGGEVLAMAAGGDGWLYVAGSFSALNGQSRSGLARIPLSGTGSPPDPNWTPSPSGVVRALLLDEFDVLIGGDFQQVSGLNRSRLARMSRSAGAAVDTDWAPSANGRVSALMKGADGDLVVGGSFTELGGSKRGHLGKVRGNDGGLVSEWDPAPTGEVLVLRTDGNDWLYAGGSFGFVGVVHQSAAARIRYNGSGEVDTTWRPQLQPGIIQALAVTLDGSVVLGGSLRHINQTGHRGAARLDHQGTIQSPLDLDRRGVVKTLLPVSDGSVVVAGGFHHADGHARSGVAKISATGELDMGWYPQISPFEYVNAVAIDAQDRIYLGGYFSQINGTPVTHLARLSGAGSGMVDSTWAPATDGTIHAVAVSSDGQWIYAGGSYSAIGGTSRSNIARVSASGSGAADSGWGPAVNNTVNLISLGASGQVYLGGPFTQVDGVARRRLVRASHVGPGLADTVWRPEPNERVYAVDERPEGVYVSGWYTSISGISRRNIARLHEPAATADAWAPNPYGGVHALHFIDSERVLVGGNFMDIVGTPVQSLAIVTLDIPAQVEPVHYLYGNNWVYSLMPKGNAVWLGGYFDSVGTTPRFSLAAVPRPLGDPVFSHGFEE